MCITQWFASAKDECELKQSWLFNIFDGRFKQNSYVDVLQNNLVLLLKAIMF